MSDTIVRPTAQPTGRGAASPGTASESHPESLASRRSWLPRRTDWTDIVAIGVLVTIGVFGFGKAYGGTRYFVAGVVGTVVGLVIAHLCARTRQPLLVVTAAVVLAFFVFGSPVAVPDEAIGGVMLSPASVTALVDGVVNGWARLLTTLPPAGGAGNLLVVPFTCGLVASVVGLTIAARSRRPWFAVLLPLTVLVLSILFGVRQPASLLLQGAAFASVAVGWVALRHRHRRIVAVQSRTSRRWAGAVAMLLLAGAAAPLFGASLPGANSNDRLVLRERTQPPFDPHDYPSPLNSYRKYSSPELLKDETLFTVTGLRPGERLRLATLDAYDGVVYTVGHGPGSSGYFQRVGDEIPSEAEGSSRIVTVEVDGYNDVWMPTFGEVRSIEFLSGRGDELAGSLRFNTTTGTAATPALMQSGDRYRLETVVPELDAKSIDRGNAADVRQPAAVTIEQVGNQGQIYAEGEDGATASALARVENILAAIQRDGTLSDGDEGQAPSRPGHGAHRLASMVDRRGGAMVGNAEQYAPLAALMAKSVGVPARVVMGFTTPEGYDGTGPVQIKGEQVTAWIEVAIDGAGWVPFFDVDPENQTLQELPQPNPKPQPVTPPPPPPPVPTTEEDETDPNKVQQDKPKCADPSKKDDPKCADDDGFRIPAFVYYAGAGVLTPVLVLGSFTGAIALLKSRRRARRRTEGAPADRISGGWDEVTDLASDFGAPVPPLATRREAASMIGNSATIRLAAHADASIFGPEEPDDAVVTSYWSEVDGTRRAMVADRTRFERWKALVNVASLRSSRQRRRIERAERHTLPRTPRDPRAPGLQVAPTPEMVVPR